MLAFKASERGPSFPYAYNHLTSTKHFQSTSFSRPREHEAHPAKSFPSSESSDEPLSFTSYKPASLSKNTRQPSTLFNFHSAETATFPGWWFPEESYLSVNITLTYSYFLLAQSKYESFPYPYATSSAPIVDELNKSCVENNKADEHDLIKDKTIFCLSASGVKYSYYYIHGGVSANSHWNYACYKTWTQVDYALKGGEYATL